MAEPVELIPPENFAMVENGIYRGGFPKKRHFPFLAQLLRVSFLEPHLRWFGQRKFGGS